MWPPEDSYGLRKRVEFVAEAIASRSPRRILDYGCGTGLNLTLPLAQHFPRTGFTGLDSDPASIAFARRQVGDLRNVEFRLADECLKGEEAYDLIIASEVLEHVDEPIRFMLDLRSRLADGGAILLTVPNGYGPFEWASLAEALLHVSGTYGLLRRVARTLRGRAPAPGTLDTLAVSPHVNFFAYRELLRLFSATGLQVLRYRARTFLCGFGLDQLLRGPRVLTWNARVSDRLPAQWVSDWMFVLEPSRERTEEAAQRFQRGAYARFRRRLNLRRTGVDVPRTSA